MCVYLWDTFKLSAHAVEYAFPRRTHALNRSFKGRS